LKLNAIQLLIDVACVFSLQYLAESNLLEFSSLIDLYEALGR